MRPVPDVRVVRLFDFDLQHTNTVLFLRDDMLIAGDFVDNERGNRIHARCRSTGGDGIAIWFLGDADILESEYDPRAVSILVEIKSRILCR